MERLDSRLDSLLSPSAEAEVLAEGYRWTEGPLWDARNGRLLFSDVPQNSIFQWTAKSGVSLFLKPSGYTGEKPRGGEPGSNGLAWDPQGRLVLCEHGDRRVSRLEPDGGRTTLADRYDGKRFNSPNDLCFRANGDLYFTDPPYGLEGGVDDPARELDFQGVYRVTSEGSVDLIASDLSRPNGIALSPDGTKLYVANSDPESAFWKVFELDAEGNASAGKVFFDATSWTGQWKGLPDGLKLDRAGNLFATGPGGVWIFAPDGTPLGRVRFEKPVANCAWGGDGSTLFFTVSDSVGRIPTLTRGAGWPPPD